jgi:hypothetical protein
MLTQLRQLMSTFADLAGDLDSVAIGSERVLIAYD